MVKNLFNVCEPIAICGAEHRLPTSCRTLVYILLFVQV